MPWFAYAINDDPKQPDIDTGFIEAPSIRLAVLKLADSRVNVYEMPPDWTPDE